MTWKDLPDEPCPPQRPTKVFDSKVGRPIRLTTNHFEVSVKNVNTVIYHYDVSIKDHQGKDFPVPLPKSKNMKIFEKMKESFPKVFTAPMSYDLVKNAYSTQLVPQFKKKAVTYEVALDPEDGRKSKSNYKVTIVKVNQASLKDLFNSMKYTPGVKKEMPTTIVQMIEVMFRHYRAKKYIQVSTRNFFSVTGEFARPYGIEGGKEGMAGFFGSLRPAAWKDGSILLNLDMAHTAFYKEQSVFDFIKEHDFRNAINFKYPLGTEDLYKFTKSLKGLKVRVNYGNRRTYKIFKIGPLGADKQTFEMQTEGGAPKKVTVLQYMKDAYGIRLDCPSFNCLNCGNLNKDVYIPMELCRIDKGQRVTKKLSDREVANFIRATAVPPAERLKQIKSVALKNEFNKDPMLGAMTFTIADMPLQTTGRVLPPPSLTMKKQSFCPDKGVWDIRNKQFHAPATLTHWAVINYDGFKTQMTVVNKFISNLVRMGRERGMKIEEPFDTFEFVGSRGKDPNPREDFEYYKKKNPEIQMIMCILPAKKYYGAIKKAGDTEVNIVTQCVVSANVVKCQDQTIGNILLKINAKMDGINNIVTPLPRIVTGILTFAEPFLIMGADVNHPPAGGDESIPSIAAVVGSCDPNCTRYAVERRAQYHRVETIQSLKEITKNLLVNFYKKTKKKPMRIIMYRDGVSESQFQGVLATEMKAIRDACLTLDSGNYKPGITFICVQKRHHTRLFCDERDGIGKSGNIPPGTVVDRDITHPTETDFFLCSHQGIQGTSRPTHYHLLWDDNDLPIDELQAMTYRLCHVYSRCTRSVSIPTPVYYAHLAAFRAKVYASEILGTGSDSGSTLSGEADMQKFKLDIERTARVTVNEAFSSKLHYI